MTLLVAIVSFIAGGVVGVVAMAVLAAERGDDDYE